MMRSMLIFGLAAILLTIGGCHYYEEYRIMKSTADIQDEKAELLRAYRHCLVKYQEDSPKAKDLCAPYTQSLREFDIKHQVTR